MKKLHNLIIAIGCTIACQNAQAQTVEVIPMIGNIFQSTYYGYEGRIEFSNGLAYGGMITYNPNRYIEVGVSVINQETVANFESSYPLEYPSNSVNAGIINYTASFARNFGDWEKVMPFMGIDIGCIQFYEKNSSRQDYFRMSVGFKGGLKIILNDNINFRIQPQIEMPIQSFGLGVGVGTGGASVGATTFASMVQFGIMGGLGIRIK